MRILVVEDEARLAENLRDGLEADGYTVHTAGDGMTGLLLARRFPYDAMVLDLLLPRLNGYQVCARLRRDGSTVPILMLTAKDGEYDEAEALDTGADDYLTKPFSYVVLLARLRALLRRGGAARASTVTVGDLHLDVTTKRCRLRGTEIPLTSKEFAVLECLARQPGRVVAKSEILDEVWERGDDGDVNIVEVYIGGLRRKLDVTGSPGRRSIETVRGAGYRMAPDA
ncbi:response regulator transcription factor [Virgisporangium aurantiacum]|uniref:DNA-binding response regulator n=1 Tax=Virgisporangium aurantiacum TaxID=175570 RepID=A0A8J3ZET5_9ACTN|nr:response regulator transcription factor [Virgisporangium aurantiacum]GIJ60291.1 DNA-binding response regulator [Virgisporangium aurantiacum]